MTIEELRKQRGKINSIMQSKGLVEGLDLYKQESFKDVAKTFFGGLDNENKRLENVYRIYAKFKNLSDDELLEFYKRNQKLYLEETNKLLSAPNFNVPLCESEYGILAAEASTEIDRRSRCPKYKTRSDIIYDIVKIIEDLTFLQKDIYKLRCLEVLSAYVVDVCTVGIKFAVGNSEFCIKFDYGVSDLIRINSVHQSGEIITEYTSRMIKQYASYMNIMNATVEMFSVFEKHQISYELKEIRTRLVKSFRELKKVEDLC